MEFAGRHDLPVALSQGDRRSMGMHLPWLFEARREIAPQRRQCVFVGAPE